MGRHEPLTSLALGRSPYDDVVDGEGEADPQEPLREHDQHGRVVNDESKQMNKDIIRAHNEVMLVVGVAEQEPGGSSSSGEDPMELYNEYANDRGRYFLRLGRGLIIAGQWGVHGVRRRILVYKETAKFPFFDLMLSEARTYTIPQLFLAGIPSFVSAWSLQFLKKSALVRRHYWLRASIGYIRFHLQIFVLMQRLGLIPGSRWFPTPSFFIPFSSSSPFLAPPPLGSPGAQSLPEWAGRVAMSVAPYAAYYLMGRIWDDCRYLIRRRVHKSLPHPWPSSVTNLRPLAPTGLSRRQSSPESPTLGDADRDIRHTQGLEAGIDSPAANGEGIGESLPMGTIRRQGTFSSRGGDDYATDEEDADMINPTLISFDVDTSESNEPPAGIWSAELRPSNSSDPRAQPKEGPRYIVNTLTNLPSLLAGDILTSSLTHILLAPIDILVVRGMARAFARKFGLPIDDMFEVNLADGSPARMVLNLFQVEGLKFVISFGIWAAITHVAQRRHYTHEERETCLEAVQILMAAARAEATGVAQS